MEINFEFDTMLFCNSGLKHRDLKLEEPLFNREGYSSLPTPKKRKVNN